MKPPDISAKGSPVSFGIKTRFGSVSEILTINHIGNFYWNTLYICDIITATAAKAMATVTRMSVLLIVGWNVCWPRPVLPLVSYGEYADGTGRRTDGRMSDRYITLSVRRGKRYSGTWRIFIARQLVIRSPFDCAGSSQCNRTATLRVQLPVFMTWVKSFSVQLLAGNQDARSATTILLLRNVQ